jgi:uncharacterized repeat protein (TIGR01451 family)
MCRLWTVGLLVALCATPVVADAQEAISAQAMSQIQALLAEKAARTPVQRRIDSQLLAAYRMKQGIPVAQGMASLPGVWGRVKLLAGDVVLVDIKADVSPGLLATLAKMGVAVESSFPNYQAIRARIPIGLVESVAALPGILFVEPAHEATTNTGAVTSQGDAAHKAPQARALGLTGAGVKIGVLSDGVDSRATSIGTGDLPAGLTVLTSQAGTGDEGTAMLEIVHDLAPSAQLYFATAFNGVASFATNIQALQAAGCNVIIDDVTYFNEGAFQDGPVAQAVNTVTAAGALYFSSAANSGNLTSGTSGTWEGDFVDSGTTIPILAGEGPIHSFGGGFNYDALTAATSYIDLKWSDPLGASANDYDLFVFNSTLSTLLAFSTNTQNGTQDPYELAVASGSFPANSRIVVTKFSGAARALRIDTNRGRLAIATAGSTFGHNAAENAITLAATDAGAGTPFVGGSTNPIEFYSSDGPRKMFYNPNGSAITPGNVLFGTGGGKVLQKPDFTAADCMSTTLASFTPFCGTSAAAPHAGAIAGLLLSASPAPTPALVRSTMTATALDIMAAGVDRDSGSGIVMADRGAAAADLAVKVLGPASVALGTNAVYTITVTNNGFGTASSVSLSDPTPTGLTFVSNTGDCATTFPCALGSLAPGVTRTITSTFAIPCAYGGPSPFSNTALVATSTIDPVSSNNSSTASTLASALPDLAITKTGSSTATLGGDLVYTITVTNNACASAASVQVSDPTPAGVTFVSNTGDCTLTFPCSLGTLASGALRTITSTFNVPVSYPAPAPIVNTATVSSPTGDANTTNNTATATSRFRAAFFTLTPCRLADTRDPASPNGPPALQPNQDRTFVLSGTCNLPVGARAVALNVTVTQGTALGDLRLFPADVTMPLVSTINFAAGQTRANNAVVTASADGTVSIKVHNDSAGPVQFILDVTGYFE